MIRAARWTAVAALAFVLCGLNAAEPAADTDLRPDEVLVIANRCSPDSLHVAAHYRERRGIPEGNLFLLDYAEYRALEPLDDNPAWLSHDDFRTRMAEPLKRFLAEHGLRERILCLVTTIDTPYRVGGFTLNDAELADPTATSQVDAAEQRPTKLDMEYRKANASFDSELAWLYRPEADAEGLTVFGRKGIYRGWSANPYQGEALSFREFRARQLAHPEGGLQYLVARLDAPTVDLADALVDKAIAAESAGPHGTAYFDAGGPGLGKQGMEQGDWWIRRASEITSAAGLPTVLDSQPALFAAGACPEALLYWGWYRVFDYQDAFNGTLAPGAIACHIASFEAANLRWQPAAGATQNGPWCNGLLRAGAAVTIGPVSEPYLESFPDTELFFPRLLAGRSVAEVYWNAVPHVSWMQVLFGDPLYAPYRGRER